MKREGRKDGRQDRCVPRERVQAGPGPPHSDTPNLFPAPMYTFYKVLRRVSEDIQSVRKMYSKESFYTLSSRRFESSTGSTACGTRAHFSSRVPPRRGNKRTMHRHRCYALRGCSKERQSHTGMRHDTITLQNPRRLTHPSSYQHGRLLDPQPAWHRLASCAYALRFFQP